MISHAFLQDGLKRVRKDKRQNTKNDGRDSQRKEAQNININAKLNCQKKWKSRDGQKIGVKCYTKLKCKQMRPRQNETQKTYRQREKTHKQS